MISLHFKYKTLGYYELKPAQHRARLKAIFHCSRFARAGGAGFENLLTRA
jgi:hypothetical protein